MASEKRRDNQGRLLPTNVTQRSNGTYQYSYTLNGTRHFCYSKSLSGIKQKMAEIQQDIQSGISTKNPILNDYFSDFMETVKKPRLKESSYNAQMDSWNLYVRDGLGRKRVKDVRRTDIIRALNDLILKKVFHGEQ